MKSVWASQEKEEEDEGAGPGDDDAVGHEVRP